MLVQFVAVAALPLFICSALAADCARTYTVTDNDICDSISAANNASTYQLAAVNSGTIDSACSNLIPGKQICLGTVGEDCQTTHVVRADDTCDGIASAHGINLTLLHTNNPNVEDGCANIYIGQVLCVADSVLVPSAPKSSVPATEIPPKGGAPPVTPGVVQNVAVAQDDGQDDEDLPWCDEL